MSWMNSKNILVGENIWGQIEQFCTDRKERLVAWDQGGRLIMCGQMGTFRLMKRPVSDCGSGDRDIWIWQTLSSIQVGILYFMEGIT